MATLLLRCKTENGQQVLNGIQTDFTLKQLIDQVATLTKIPTLRIKLKYGFPPKLLDTRDGTVALSALPLKSGDTLIVEQTPLPTKVTESSSSSTLRQFNMSDHYNVFGDGPDGILLRKVVPADNSCLFTSIGFVMNNGHLDLSCSSSMRRLIAETVKKDAATYNDAFLGKTNSAYCKWILNRDSWGGAIEVSILSNYYKMEICVLDTQSGCLNRFGEDAGYEMRVFLIYDGIHYDPLMLEPLDPQLSIRTKFPRLEDNVMKQAQELVTEAKSAKHFTDVHAFRLKCLVCSVFFTGQKEAQNHAKETGHANFGEQ